VGDRVGSLEVGKDADLALFDGDPFEFTSHVVGVIVDGEVVSQELH
jgi:imidazolonepropionase-like amidohydrolase